MVVRKPALRESTDLNNDSVLDGDGADVKTSVLDEDEVVADINDDGDVVTTDDDVLNEDGGEDTGEDLEDIGDDDLDALLNESDDEDADDKDGEDEDEKLDEGSPIDNFHGKQAPPFNADDAKEARAKKEAEGDDEKDNGDKKDEDEENDDKKDGGNKDDEKDLKEDFDDPAEVIDPVLYADDEPVVEEFGEIPDAVPSYPDEPIVELESEDGFVSEVDIDAGVTAPSYEVDTPFILPESRKVVVSRGDVIFFCGKSQKNLPSFAESTFARAAKMLVKNKKMKGAFLTEGKKSERVAIIGRSCLVEVSRDWRLPGTDTIFEKGDILQIVSRKQISEKEVKVRK